MRGIWRESVDDETREALTAILGSSRATARSMRSFEEAIRRAEVIGRVRPTPEPKPEPTTRASETEYNISTKEETAAVSVNLAGACLVLNAVLSREVEHALVTRIAPRYRKQRNNVWEIHPSQVSQLKAILKEFYKDVQMVGGHTKVIPSTKFDKLMSKLAGDDKTKIYRLLALKYHPDNKGGSHEMMSLINEVFKQG
jgi:hypothetical protein